MSLPQIGQTAPDFTLHNPDDQSVTLSDFRGQLVLLYFYPKAMTPGCTTQACALRDHYADFREKNVVILGISPDSTTRLRRFADKESLPFLLLSDENHAVAESYGVWGPKKFMGRTFDGIHRVSFLIDQNGLIVQVMPKVKAARHHEDVLLWLN